MAKDLLSGAGFSGCTNIGLTRSWMLRQEGIWRSGTPILFYRSEHLSLEGEVTCLAVKANEWQSRTLVATWTQIPQQPDRTDHMIFVLRDQGFSAAALFTFRIISKLYG